MLFRPGLDKACLLTLIGHDRRLEEPDDRSGWCLARRLGHGRWPSGQPSRRCHLSRALIDLLQHPAELGKVLAGQHRILPDGAPLDVPTVHGMSCLDRALRETSRLRPVAPVRTPTFKGAVPCRIHCPPVTQLGRYLFTQARAGQDGRPIQAAR